MAIPIILTIQNCKTGGSSLSGSTTQGKVQFLTGEAAVASSTVEDYIKQIFALQQQVATSERVAPGQIASAMNVVPGTATTMLNSLADAGLVEYASRQGVRLTGNGRKLALRILRRHRLIESFLVRVLNVDWADVHEDAEKLEHALSDALVDRIDDYLGRPEFDPHGDPIPSATGKLKSRNLIPLSQARPGDIVAVARVGDQDKNFLAYATQRGLTLGASVKVLESDDLGGVLRVLVSGSNSITLGQAAAAKLFVSPSN